MHSNAARYEIFDLVACIHPPKLTITLSRQSVPPCQHQAFFRNAKRCWACVDRTGSNDQKFADEIVILELNFLLYFMALRDNANRPILFRKCTVSSAC